MNREVLQRQLDEMELALDIHGSGEEADPEPEEEPTGHKDEWPAPMADEAFYGLAGDFVRIVDPHTEADPAALLVQFLVAVGNLIGRGPYCRVEATEHRCNLNVGLVGRTAKGRKGTGLDQVRRPLEFVDAEWEHGRIQAGLSSGEGLIWAVRDEITRQEPIREKKMITGYQAVVIDEGVNHKRLLVVESELAGALGAITRQGNTLSPVVRSAWDRGNLQSMTKNSPAKATGAHISMIGHVTRDELRATLTATELANGFANRWMWICSRRSKCLPEGGRVTEGELRAIADRLHTIVVRADHIGFIERDATAREAWARVYPDLSEGEPGLFGAATNRAEAQALRLSLLYAVLDNATAIGLPHLRAALAVWRYADASARYIFGDALGDEIADTVDRALRAASGSGMTRTEIYRLFGQHKGDRARISAAIQLLLEYRRIRSETEATGGRPVERWYSTVAQ